MLYIASFDIGTTNVKGLSAGIYAEDIAAISFSGQMQDCIPVTHEGNPARPAILYSDSRAAEQAERMNQDLGTPAIRNITGNHLDGTLTFPKILWIKEQEPEIYQQTSVFLISAKDYVIRQLTGRNVTDPTSAATVGVMNVSKRQWESEWLYRYNIESEKLPVICPSDEIAGHVNEQASKITGLAAGTPVLCGIGDAGAATIGAGVTRCGKGIVYCDRAVNECWECT